MIFWIFIFNIHIERIFFNKKKAKSISVIFPEIIFGELQNFMKKKIYLRGIFFFSAPFCDRQQLREGEKPKRNKVSRLLNFFFFFLCVLFRCQKKGQLSFLSFQSNGPESWIVCLFYSRNEKKGPVFSFVCFFFAFYWSCKNFHFSVSDHDFFFFSVH